MAEIKSLKQTALYIRVSTDSQFEEGYSVDAQKEKLKTFCRLKDITNYEFYIDGGWSGSNIERPEMKRMINEIRNGQISAVIVYKLDRLSRSQKDTIFLLEDVFIPNNCNFISLQENFDTTTPYGKAMIGILSVFAQLERENIRERTRMGMHERVKSGLWMGGGRVPFGYDYDKNQNILVPNQNAKDVQQIYDLYLQGYSTTQLAKMFDVAGDRHIGYILDRIVYTGKILYNGEIVEGKHQPIISQDVWDRVQIEREKRSTKKLYKSQHLLTGLIYCGNCKARMRYQKWGKNSIKIYCYSQQTSKQNLVKDANCDNDKYDACDIESTVLSDLFNHTDNITSSESQTSIKTSVLDVLNQKYEKISNKIKKLFNLYAASDEDNLLLETIKDNQKELCKIENEIKRAKKALTISNEAQEDYKCLYNLRENWNKMTIQQQRKALKICIERIEIYHGAINIVYNV